MNVNDLHSLPILTSAVSVTVILTGIGILTVCRAIADRVKGKK